MYKAAEIKYGIPWLMLWIVHAHETEASRNENPGQSGYRGAMQRDPRHPISGLADAMQGFEFLSELKQRYHDGPGVGNKSSDFAEIMWSARFFRNRIDDRLNKGINTTEERALLATLAYDYSAEVNGLIRRRHYEDKKPLFV